MIPYLIRRILLIIPVLILASLVVFTIIRLIPGDIVALMLTSGGSSGMGMENREAVERALGLNVPIHVQYGEWIGNIILHGDFGNSLWSGTPVIEEIAQKIPVTIELVLLSLVFAVIIAFPIGIYSAIRQDTVGDYVWRSFAILLICVPPFWVGLLVVVYSSLLFHWSPPLIYVPFFKNPVENLSIMIIPALIQAMFLAGINMRMLRTMMIEVLRQDYIRTAWAKGLRERTVVLRHAVKNALIPVVTLTGTTLVAVIGGNVIVERIFNLPGLGLLMLRSVVDRDYTMVVGVMLVFAVAVALINLVVDLTYALLDPRIRYQTKKG